jgi:hypothetical protein
VGATRRSEGAVRVTSPLLPVREGQLPTCRESLQSTCNPCQCRPVRTRLTHTARGALSSYGRER